MLPIVLIPGLLCSGEMFSRQTALLWKYGSVLVANTLEGTTIPEIASHILDVASGQFVLGAISMGGYIALEIVRQAPERVAKLALLNTSARPDTPEQSAGRRELLSKARESADFPSFAVEILDQIMIPKHRGIEALRQVNRNMALAVGLDGFVRQSEAAIGRSDSRPLLSSISVPTLVVTGESDQLIPPAHSREIAAGIQGSRLVIVPECGHASTLEQPNAVNEALLDWVRS